MPTEGGGFNNVPIEIPCRAGYTFLGWATEEGGEAVYGIESETFTNKDDGSFAFYLYHTLTDKMLKDAGYGTVLYAVWEKAE